MMLINTILFAKSFEDDDDLILRFLVEDLNETSDPDKFDNIDDEFETSINNILLKDMLIYQFDVLRDNTHLSSFGCGLSLDKIVVNEVFKS